MKEFFKFMFASMLGFIITLVIAIFLFVAMVASFVSFAEKEAVDVENNTVLEIKLDKQIYDRAPKIPFGMFNPGTFELNQYLGLNEILKNIEKAKDDPRISGIYLNVDNLQAGLSTVMEIRNALQDFKTSGKFIVAYSETYSQGAYYLATVADKVYLNPDGLIDFKGLSAQLFFLKGTLDKLDIKMNVIRHGNYKSAVEPFMNDKMSDYNREQLQAMVDDLWSNMLLGISESRGISTEELNTIADNLDAYDAGQALSMKLVDALYYKDQVTDDLKERVGATDDEKVTSIKLTNYFNSTDPARKRYYNQDKIAVIYAIGSIQDGQGDDITIGSKRISEAIRKARKNDKVKAIVMRVNSPGGSALASEVIRREVELARQEKPFIVSMGDVAASGGYWISCSADKIIADPTTITGSIGVFGMFPEMGDFFKNKLGITFDHVNSNKNSDFIDLARKIPEDQYKAIEKQIDKIYDKFLKLVADGRKMTVEEVDQIAQGRVWSAVDAKEIGLVDELGGLNTSIEKAAEMAGITDYSIYELPFQKDPLTLIREKLTGEASASLLKKELGQYYDYYALMMEMQGQQGIMARLPYGIRIK